MTTIANITSRHASVTAAVEAAGIDLSYNEGAARNTMKNLDREVKEAFVTDTGSVYYVFECDIRLLNQFEPFISALDDSAFRIVTIEGDAIRETGIRIPKGKAGRKAVRTLQSEKPAFLAH